jgi:hypothetical protein
MREHEPLPPGQAESASRAGRGVGAPPHAQRLLALQRTAGNRATRQYLQRMIVAIDGDNDEPKHLRATRACLWNLRHNKGGRQFADSGARGAVAGPAVLGNLNFHMRPKLKTDGESIYVLAHGSRYSPSIAGLTPVQMAQWLRDRFSHRDKWGPLGWLGFTTQLATPFTGKIKLVSCHSAADKRHRASGDTSKIYPFDRSYAEALARALAPTGPKDPFQPSTVQGINGIGWVDELSGRITAIDKGAYDTATAPMTDNSDIGGKGGGTVTNPFTSVKDPAARGAAIHAIFGDPVEAKVTPTGGLRTGKGEWGKRRFEVGTGKEL